MVRTVHALSLTHLNCRYWIQIWLLLFFSPKFKICKPSASLPGIHWEKRVSCSAKDDDVMLCDWMKATYNRNSESLVTSITMMSPPYLHTDRYLTPTGQSSPVEESMALLTQAVYDLGKLYLRSFCPPSYSSPQLPQAADGDSVEETGSKEASGTTDHLQFTLFALHGIPPNWISR